MEYEETFPPENVETIEGTEVIYETEIPETEEIAGTEETIYIHPDYFSTPAEPLATEGETIILAALYDVKQDIVHTQLFGSFLVCGAIIGALLLRRWQK